MTAQQRQHVAIFGATGQIGFPLSRSLLDLGHQVTAITRQRTPSNAQQLASLERDGARVVQENLHNIKSLTGHLSGCDVVVIALRMNVQLLDTYGPLILAAARQAGVARFIPNEFGLHTLGIDYGVGALFDAKKRYHEQLFASGLDWTLFYNGCIFDYFLPNLRMFERITTYGDLDMPITSHHIDDIGAIAARTITDPRTRNQAVQLQANVLSQRHALETLRNKWPGVHFNYTHIPCEQIERELATASPDHFSAKAGAENDLERWGINKAIFVLGKLSDLDHPLTLNATELYPDYRCIQPEEMLGDEEFVFGDDSVA